MMTSPASLPVSNEAISELLQFHGISPTSQRVAIATILLDKRQHLSADQVLRQLTDRGMAVSKATVYNTLGLFAERQLIRQVIVDPTKVFYDSNIDAHHHFYNVDDGTLTDVDAADVPIDQLPNVPQGTVAEAVDIVIRVRNLPRK